MTVEEYINTLDQSLLIASQLCNATNPKKYDKKSLCHSCVMEKHEGKPCPVAQLTDVKRALQYAVKHKVNGITEETPVDDSSVVLFMRRVVILGYSVRTLRYCSDEYIKERNLIEIPVAW